MSKRKNRSSAPNIPQATLDRARQQLAGDVTPVPEEPVEPAVEAVEAEVEDTLEPVKATPAASSRVAAQRAAAGASRSRAASGRRLQSVQAKGGRKELLDTEAVKNRLLHPTRVVTEAELREQYGYVIRDLRMIAIIAAAMIILMVVLAQIL
ncbi:MAG: hypothetical protein K8I30_01130 [Anaerolineae bacterium]|nr:hypothetical protein [Anaerolineae bacterium]